MPHRFRVRSRIATLPVMVLAGAALLACGDGTVEPDDSVAPVVGDWDATRMLLTHKSNPSISADLISELGGRFFLSVEPSGQYTAQLRIFEQTASEFGRVALQGDQMILYREFPEADTSRATWRLAGDRLFLEGDVSFDFNNDGEAEEARSEIDLVRRD